MRVPKLAGGPDREIRVLGGAAPLSSRKTGYLLRVAHMIPIIFPPLWRILSALPGVALIGWTSLATLLNAWEQLYFFTVNYMVRLDKEF